MSGRHLAEGWIALAVAIFLPLIGAWAYGATNRCPTINEQAASLGAQVRAAEEALR